MSTLGNLLIQGDAAATLDALMPQLEGAVDLIYIDPPYNTGSVIESHGSKAGYHDDLGHTAWLTMMREVLTRLQRLLSPTGSLLVHLDDNELDYLKVAADEIFGRQNFLNRIIIAARSPSSFSTVNRGVFKSSEYLLWYARDRDKVRCDPVRVPRSPDRAYNMYLINPEAEYGDWRFTTVSKACPPNKNRDRFQVENAERVCRLATISDKKAGKSTVAMKHRSKEAPEQVFRVEREGLPPRYVTRGQQIIFYDRQVARIDGQVCASRPLTNIWNDLRWEGLSREGGVTFRKGKKPEALLRRVLQLTTGPGDRVLDCFVGSGTTAAVAHKCGRQWIGIESEDHITMARERLDAVVLGQEPTGVTAAEGWDGGGSFTFLSTAELTSHTQSTPEPTP